MKSWIVLTLQWYSDYIMQYRGSYRMHCAKWMVKHTPCHVPNMAVKVHLQSWRSRPLVNAVLTCTVSTYVLCMTCKMRMTVVESLHCNKDHFSFFAFVTCVHARVIVIAYSMLYINGMPLVTCWHLTSVCVVLLAVTTLLNLFPCAYCSVGCSYCLVPT